MMRSTSSHRISKLFGKLEAVFVLVVLVGAVLFMVQNKIVNADAVSELQGKINAKNTDIAALEKEIQGYQKQIDALGSQATSLSSTIRSLDLNRKKLEANIAVTQDKITAKNLEIQQLGTEITGKQLNIKDNQRIISRSLVEIDRLDEKSLPEIFLSSESVSGALNSLDELGSVQGGLYERINSLRQVKADLEHNKTATEKAKEELMRLNKQLSDQRAIAVSTIAEQNKLLSETKQSEASYKKILADKKAQEAALQAEIQAYESQLHILVNPSSIPHTGSGVLSWPLDKVYVTQYFGDTPFATANPQIYNGKGHTGVDFRASIGTPIKAALDGVVVGVENTDKVPRCYSYGKWVMVKHANGLSTLYAHMSLQSVVVGQEVSTGQLLGYSGNTGYSTGPHLHFGVYATQGVQIKRFDNSVNCKGAVIPVADYSAYLNPLSYL